MPTGGYTLQEEILERSPDGKDLVLGLNIRGDGRLDVIRYVEESGSVPNAFLFLSPGAASIAT